MDIEMDEATGFDDSQYARGSIKMVYMKNFMTYKEATARPGPRLNLVLGPNGSGKSSVVCSICVGLNGSTKLLGRANTLREFVKKGHNNGMVRITISGGVGKPDIVFERQMCALDNKSTWKINGAVKMEKDVTKETQKLNIQLDNLCQFLPQEKVGEFAKMSPEELLKNTERAIGDAHLLRMHESLTEGSKVLQAKEDELSNATRQLNTLVTERDGMARDVEKIEEQQALQAEAKQLRQRAAWLQVAHAETIDKNWRRAYKEQLGRQKEVKANLERKQGPLKQKQQLEKQLNDKAKQASARLLTLQGASTAAMDFLDDTAEDQLAEVHKNLQQCDTNEAKRQEELANARKLLETIDEQSAVHADTPAPVDPAQERALKAEKVQISQQLAGVAHSKAELLNELENYRAVIREGQTRLQQLRQVDHQRLQQLNQRFRGIAEFKSRVDQMRSEKRFRSAVYGPVALEIRMACPAEHAVDALEMHIPARLFSCFVTEQHCDQDLLQKVARDMNYRLNCVNYTGNPNAALIHRSQPASAHAAFGITHTLDEVFDAPMTVKHVLDNNAGITNTYLMDDDRTLQAVFDNTDIRTVYSRTTRSTKKVSKYNAESRYVTGTALTKARLLAGQADQREIEGTEATISEAQQRIDQREPESATLHAEEERLLAAKAKVESQLKALADKARKHEATGARLKAKRSSTVNKIRELEKKAPLKQKAEHTRTLAKIKQDICRNVDVLVKTQVDTVEAFFNKGVASANKLKAAEEIAALQQASRAEEQELVSIDNAVLSAKTELDRARDAYVLARDAAEALLPKDDAEAHAALAELPDNAAECSQAADALEDKADAIAVGDPGTVQRYKTLCRTITDREAAVAAVQATVTATKAELEDARLKWLPELKEKVKAISAQFSDNFKRIGSVGEVGLRECGELFSKYAIEIRVKFRDNEDLEVLDAHYQSGGERSVSTIMYLLALQNITQSPLRVVDEINQGMDNTNERKVFQAMVDAATEDGTPQCLLMTPKLLTGLEYSKHVNVMKIHNGQDIHELADKFNPEDVCSVILGTHA